MSSKVWPEIRKAGVENKYELILSGPEISKRIEEADIDRKLFCLTNLNYLNISETCMKQIRDDIGRLINLTTLVLHSNQMPSVPNTIGKLNKLKVLDLSRNKLISLPEEIKQLSLLATLNLAHNELKSLPNLSQNVNLANLDVSYNQFEEFPDICHPGLAHLGEVKLRSNKIINIPPEINFLVSLKSFDVMENQILLVPAELSDISKLKDLNMKSNPLSDRRLLKLVENGGRQKQIMDYIRQYCPRTLADPSGNGGKGKKGKKGKTKEEAEAPENEEDAIAGLVHKIEVLRVSDTIPKVVIDDQAVEKIRPFIVCCIVRGVTFTPDNLKAFIKMQTILHETICEKRNVATIATHDLDRLAPGNVKYTAKTPGAIKIQPLGNEKLCSAAQLYAKLKREAEDLRKEKNRNVYSGIHKYLYLLDKKQTFCCLLDSSNQVISFPPITNSEISKISEDTKNMFFEVTSSVSMSSCTRVMDALIRETLLLGLGGEVAPPPSDSTTTVLTSPNQLYCLTVQQVSRCDLKFNFKSVYPSRVDLQYDNSIYITRNL